MRDVIKKFGVNVLSFGGADESGDFSGCIQRAFDSGERFLFLPAGSYRVDRPLMIRSYTNFALDDDAVVTAGDGAMVKRGDFLLRNADIETGNESIIVTGGTWDGNYRGNPKSDILSDTGYSGTMLNFVNVHNLVLSDMTLRNSAAYFTRFAYLSEFLIENIRLSHDKNISNNDGVHFCGFCQNGVVKNVCGVTKGTPNDDMIALNADDMIERTENRDLPNGYIRNLLIDEIYAESCHCFVRLLSIKSDISNIIIRNVRGGANVRAINGDAGRYCRTPIIDPKSPEYTRGVGYLKNIVFDGMSVAQEGATTLIQEETNADNLTIYNYERPAGSGGGPTLHIRNISPSSIKLYGLTQAQYEQLRSDSICEGIRTTKTVDGLYNLDVTTVYNDSLLLKEGGFAFFSQDKL